MLWQVGNERATALYLASLPETYRPPGRKAEEAKLRRRQGLLPPPPPLFPPASIAHRRLQRDLHRIQHLDLHHHRRLPSQLGDQQVPEAQVGRAAVARLARRLARAYLQGGAAQGPEQGRPLEDARQDAQLEQ